MRALRIHHKTSYKYSDAVSLGPHRLMLRPRESRDLKLISHEILMTPEAKIIWAHDVAGNAVATASFELSTDILTIESVAEVELYASEGPVYEISESAVSYPFQYSSDDRTNLGALTAQQYPDPSGILLNWSRGFVRPGMTGTLALLQDLATGVADNINYQVREDEGTQSPIETLEKRSGSCRDFAALFADAARCLGFGARIVSGYLYSADRDVVGSAGSGSTHAWAEIYIPGAGWVTFDPTNRSFGGDNLVPVAVARNIWEVMPVTGSFVGPTNACQGMTVEVSVTAQQTAQAAPAVQTEQEAPAKAA